MNQIKTLIKKNTTLAWLLLTLVVTTPSFTTLLQPAYFGMHDDLQLMRIYQMDKCFKDGQLPCRWVPDMGYGYGYPLFNFYPVMPYYLGELIHLLGFSLIWSVKIDFILSFLVSAVTMFLLGRKLWGSLGGFLSALFYVYAPYHAVDVYVRGAMAEGWSISWAPAVFLMIYLTIEKSSLRNIALLALSIALFVMSHNPLALVFVPVMALWALILIIQKKCFWSIPKLAVAGLWALGLASFFTIPVLLEGRLVHIETLFIGYFNYLAHFVDLKQLFVSRFWGYGPSIWGPDDGLSFQIGWLHTLVMILVVTTAIFSWRKSKANSIILLFLSAVFIFYAFLMHPKSNPIWERVTILQNIQFPWRLLSITLFVSSLAAGSLITLPFSKISKVGLMVMLTAAVMFLYQGYFRIERVVPVTDQEKLSGVLWDMQRTAGIFDYLPKSAAFPPGGPAPVRPQVIKGTAEIADYKQGTNWLSFKEISSESATLRLPIIYFPNWKISVDGKDVNFDVKNELGQPTFEISSGSHNVFAKLYNTPLRTTANIVSLVSFIAFLVAAFKLIRKK